MRVPLAATGWASSNLAQAGEVARQPMGRLVSARAARSRYGGEFSLPMRFDRCDLTDGRAACLDECENWGTIKLSAAARDMAACATFDIHM